MCFHPLTPIRPVANLSTERPDVFGHINTQDSDQITKIDPIQGAVDSLHWMATVENASIVADAPLIVGFPAVG